MLLGLVMVITVVTYQQDTVTRKDSVTPPVPAPVPAPPPTPTIEQIHYLEGLKTVTRGVAQVRDGVNRVVRTEKADSLTRRRADVPGDLPHSSGTIGHTAALRSFPCTKRGGIDGTAIE